MSLHSQLRSCNRNKNMWRRALVLLPLLAGVSPSQNEITFQENGYSNVLVTISPDVPKDRAQATVDGIKVS